MASLETKAFCEKIRQAALADKCALVHETAIDAWTLDNNLIPYCLDFASKSLYAGCSIAELGDEAPRLVKFEGVGQAWVSSYQGIPVRVWHRFTGVPWRKLKRIRNDNVGVQCVDPYVVLDEMAFCPDLRFLYEQRAALAACLFVDDMPDEQLRRFIDYVRPC